MRCSTLSLLGLLCFLIAVLDLAASLAGMPFTAVEWSPMAFGLLGGSFFALESLRRDDRSSV